MRLVSLWIGTLLAAVAVAALTLSGCGDDAAPNAGTPDAGAPDDAPAEGAQPASVVDDHSGWCCYGHGVPEEVCTRCDPSLALEFQEKGDWCEDHNLPASQCFICRPELKARFAAQYEAKFGKQPPEPIE